MKQPRTLILPEDHPGNKRELRPKPLEQGDVFSGVTIDVRRMPVALKCSGID